MSISLADRIKEISYSVGTGDFILGGAFAGFSDFASSYSYGDIVYYAITDGASYEIGSGEYLFSSPNKILRRYPFKSTNNNNKINFGAGIKEVYVTYPGQKSVFTAGNFGTFSTPQNSGVAFWRTPQIVDYDSLFVWDVTNNRLGVNTSNPQHAIDVGGQSSFLRVSGIIVGASGITFPQQDLLFSGGLQREPFLRNQTDVITGTNAVFSLSGLVSEKLTFKQQSPRYIFAGPAGGIIDGFPSFRPLAVEDVPNLSGLYVSQTGVGANGQVAFYEGERIIGYDSHFVWNKNNNYLGLNKTTPTQTLDVNGNGLFAGYVDIRNYISTISGIVTSGSLFFASGNTSPVGVLNWDNDEGTLSLGMKGGNVTLNLGQENVVLCFNGTSALTKGQAVYVSGAQGQRPRVNLALANNELTAARTFGLVNETINSGAEGFVATYGVVRGINTSAFTAGSGLWLSATTPGAITMTRPTAPNHGVFIGWCVRSHASAGQIFVDVQNGHEFNELHDVLIQNLASGETIVYDSSIQAWRNRVGYTSWTLSDSGGNSKAITNGTSVTFSGANNISTIYNPTTNIVLISGSAAGGSYTSWTLADSGGNSKAITNGTSVTFSGIFGINPSYNTTTNIISINGSGLSGVLSNFATSVANAASGWARSYADAGFSASGYTGWTLADSGGNNGNIARTNTVTFSGVNGVSTIYNSTNRVMAVSGNYTAGSGIIITGNQIALSSGLISASGFASTAFIQTSGAFIPINNQSFTMSGIFNGKTLLVSGASQINVTVSGNLPIGFGAAVIQTGPGAIFYSGAPGVNIRNRQGHTRSNGAWAATSLVQFSQNNFILAGDTTT